MNFSDINNRSNPSLKLPIVRRSAPGIILVVIMLMGLSAAAWAATPAPTSETYRGIKPDEFLRTWLILGPIPPPAGSQPDEAAQRQTFATDFLKSAGGETNVRPAIGGRVTINGKERAWQLVRSTNDVIELTEESDGKAPGEFDVVYAWAEIEMKRASTRLFGIGSDDAVKVWLNGRLIHENWVNRTARPDDDRVELPLRPGMNQLLLKVQNRGGGCGFACRPLSASSLATMLVRGAGRGELEDVEALLARGVSAGSRDKRGLTAWQAARIQGHQDVAELLRNRGARGRMPSDRARLVDATFQGIVQTGWSGAAVLVARDGKVLLQRGYGLANLEHRVPVTPATKFRIGSISKQFTAAAILKLQEQGKLQLDDRLSRFFPDYPRGDEVTIHHLLTHTSGIHSYTSKPEFVETAPLFIKPGDLIQSFTQDPYDFDPGLKWSYNNSGFFLLGAIIEKVSGVSYDDYLRTTFFEPLGLTASEVHQGTAVLANEAHGYAFTGGRMKKALNWDMSRAGGAGALYSTVGDLNRWNEALFSGQVLDATSLKAAFTPVRTAGNNAEKLEEGYGYGWAIGKLRGQLEISHGGGLHGFLSYLLRLPQERLTVVVLANASPAPPGLDPSALAHEIAQLYVAEKLDWRPTPRVNLSISSEAMDVCVGRYDYGGRQAILTVTREGERLFAQLTGQERFEIFPKSETEFFWKVIDARITFVRDAAGKVIKGVHQQAGRTFEVPKIE